ncbi:S-adenosyl-L-methionine-dependent methyltransferase [Elaphomyces granulatus]|jgi:SAM-dependent methyltransferase
MAVTGQGEHAGPAIDEEFINILPRGPREYDAFSGYEESQVTDTTSLTSSVLNYQYENGRRYHSYGQGKYNMPNDETEKDRLDLVHHLCLLTLKGELHLAPLDAPQAILDLGTGTGIWAIDIADKFTSARVIGNDLSAIQPSWVPPNLEFVIDDFEREWMYKPDFFDFIHARTIAGSVQSWPKLMKQALKHLKPGGYFEALEPTFWAWSGDGSLKDDSPYMQYLRHLNEAAEKTGRKLNVAAELMGWMKEAGFEDVTQQIFIIPLGPWAKDPAMKELGKWEYILIPESVEAYGLRLYTQILEWTLDEAKIHLAQVKDQLLSRSLHAYSKIYVVYGRKPLPETT